MVEHSLQLQIPLLGFVILTALDATSIIFTIPTITTELRSDATHGSWVSASFLLATCVSVPLTSHFFGTFARRSSVLASIVVLGIGSLVGDYASSMELLLAGRSIQGLGAGSLIMLSYAVYSELDPPQSATRFLRGLTGSVALGTVSGPIVGAVLSEHSLWRWAFRLNVFACLALGLAVFHASQTAPHDAVPLRFDYLGALLFISTVVPALVGLSLASGAYKWTSWQVLLLIVLGTTCLVIFICRESQVSLGFQCIKNSMHPRMLLGLKDFKSLDAMAVFISAFLLGLVMYGILFLLPIYYLVVQGQSQMKTALLLLPQTAPILPCAFLVLTLLDRNPQTDLVVLLGWLVTASGVGLLTTLDSNKSLPFCVLLNLLSGFGIGILLTSLSARAKAIVVTDKALQAQTLFLSLRYLGNAFGMVVVGIAFQLLLKATLSSTEFYSRAAGTSTKVTALVYSVRKTQNKEELEIMIGAVQQSLEKIWIGLAVTCVAALLLCGTLAMLTSGLRRLSATV